MSRNEILEDDYIYSVDGETPIEIDSQIKSVVLTGLKNSGGKRISPAALDFDKYINSFRRPNYPRY